jgi:hypothetical protein
MVSVQRTHDCQRLAANFCESFAYLRDPFPRVQPYLRLLRATYDSRADLRRL